MLLSVWNSFRFIVMKVLKTKHLQNKILCWNCMITKNVQTCSVKPSVWVQCHSDCLQINLITRLLSDCITEFFVWEPSWLVCLFLMDMSLRQAKQTPSHPHSWPQNIQTLHITNACWWTWLGAAAESFKYQRRSKWLVPSRVNTQLGYEVRAWCQLCCEAEIIYFHVFNVSLSYSKEKQVLVWY